MLNGDVTLKDPQAVVKKPQDYVARLWRGKRYWLLNAGHFAGWPQSEPVRFRLPELPAQIKHAYEIDLKTLTAKETELERNESGIFVSVHHGFSAVLLPFPDCPALLTTSTVPPTHVGEKLEITLESFGPWRDVKAPVKVHVAIAGIRDGQDVVLPTTIQVQVPADALRGCYFVRMSGDCLPLKRDLWIR